MSWCAYSGTLLHSTPKAFVDIEAGPEDDTRGLCAVAYELLTGRSIKDDLFAQLDALGDWQQEAVDMRCRELEGLDEDESFHPDVNVQATVAEYLGFIAIKEVPPPDQPTC